MPTEFAGGSRRSRFLAILVIVVAVACGALLGAVLDRAWLRHHHRIVSREGFHFTAPRIARLLDRELDLSDAQEAKVRAILERRHQRIESIWRSAKPRLREEMDATNREIEAVLEPGQKGRFAELQEKWRRHSRHIFGGGKRGRR